MKDEFAIIHAGMLKLTLEEIAKADAETPPAYKDRYRLVLAAMHFATLAGLETGIALDQSEPEWPVIYIELPTGQVSWHMPQHAKPWDGHTTETKYERIRAYEPDDNQPARTSPCICRLITHDHTICHR